MNSNNGNGRTPSNSSHSPPRQDDPKLDKTLRSTLSETLTPVTLEQGMPVYPRQEKVNDFFLVEDGLLGVYRFVPPNKRILLHKILPGETVGVTQMLRNEPYPAHLVPIKNTEAFQGSRGDRESLSQNRPEVWNEIIILETSAHNRIFEKIEAAISDNVNQRIARELLDLSKRLSSKNDPPELPINLTREDISRMVGCSKESASRVLSDWEKDGTIDTQKQKITVLDPDKLRSLIGRPPE